MQESAPASSGDVAASAAAAAASIKSNGGGSGGLDLTSRSSRLSSAILSATDPAAVVAVGVAEKGESNRALVARAVDEERRLAELREEKVCKIVN